MALSSPPNPPARWSTTRPRTGRTGWSVQRRGRAARTCAKREQADTEKATRLVAPFTGHSGSSNTAGSEISCRRRRGGGGSGPKRRQHLGCGAGCRTTYIFRGSYRWEVGKRSTLLCISYTSVIVTLKLFKCRLKRKEKRRDRRWRGRAGRWARWASGCRWRKAACRCQHPGEERRETDDSYLIMSSKALSVEVHLAAWAGKRVESGCVPSQRVGTTLVRGAWAPPQSAAAPGQLGGSCPCARLFLSARAASPTELSKVTPPAFLGKASVRFHFCLQPTSRVCSVRKVLSWCW